MSNKGETCFVIMPFSQTTSEHTEDYWTQHFQTFLKPLIEQKGTLNANRAKSLRGDILRQIISDLVTARVVIADLTDHNANVFWELGVRQSFKHCTVTIAEAGTKLPFDIGGKGTLFYHPKNHLKNEAFRTDFEKALDDCLHSPDRPDSQVLETLSGRGTLFEIFRKDEALRRLDALLSECEFNLEAFDRIEKTAKTNKEKNQPGGRITTSRFRSPALTLLVTNRYLDASNTFYKLAESCLNDLGVNNDQLNMWEHTPELTESWLLKYLPRDKADLVRLRDEIAEIRAKIESRQ